MHIAILGTGNMASGLARLFAQAGHSVTLGSRDPAKAEATARELGQGVSGASLADAAGEAEMVVLAVPYHSAGETIAAAGGLAGKIVVDITNPLTPDFSGLALGYTTSAAEEIQKLVPEARVVKAFNTLFAGIVHGGGKIDGEPATVFVAGDDDAATQQVAELVTSTGMRPLRVGGLFNARYVEPMAALNISMGYALGFGTGIAPSWQGIR